MGLLDSNKFLPLEVVKTQSNVSLETTGAVGDDIDTRSYKEAMVILSNPNNGKLSLRGGYIGNSTYYPQLKLSNIYSPTVLKDYIETGGIFIVDLSNSCRLRFWNEVAISGATFNYTVLLRQNSNSNQINRIYDLIESNNKKTKIIKSTLVKVENNQNNLCTGNSIIDMSEYRFYVVRVRTMVSPTSAGYVNHSFIVSTEWTGEQAEGESSIPPGILSDSILVGDNVYNAISDWNELLMPKLRCYIKVIDSTAPSSENPVYLHVDLIGIR